MLFIMISMPLCWFKSSSCLINRGSPPTPNIPLLPKHALQAHSGPLHALVEIVSMPIRAEKQSTVLPCTLTKLQRHVLQRKYALTYDKTKPTSCLDNICTNLRRWHRTRKHKGGRQKQSKTNPSTKFKDKLR